MVLALLVLYCGILVVLSAYGVHRAHLAITCIRLQKRLGQLCSRVDVGSESALPRVTIQLPLYNEATVARRLIEATGAMDYPVDRLEIQVLDDSTDETTSIASAAVQSLQARGIDAVYVRRPDRHGYKAGALDFGLQTAKGELIAIFDADFIPQRSFLREVVGHFQNERIAMVQTRWDHLNRSASLLTSVQALMLDGHHMVENRARYATGCMFNFSGTGGIWRRRAIDDAGGWQHDTLTEDLDLSYRAQLAGWRFVYRGDVCTPAELPEDMIAFRAQQYRWAKGTVQTARKLLGRVLRAPLPLSMRIEAAFHMLPHLAYPMMVLLSLVLLPSLVFMPASDLRTLLLLDLPLCIGTTGSLASFYAMAEVSQGRSAWNAIQRLPALIAIGAGLSPHLTLAVFDGMSSMAGEFVRTPKRGSVQGRYRQYSKLPLAEIALAAINAASVVAALQTGHWLAAPFAAIFCAGYTYVALLVMRERFGRVSRLPTLAESSSEAAGDMARAA
jgi:cellulose synthase/poly-beta-1,6-N-acetylglucosamine synthase-like glycosyltransferase